MREIGIRNNINMLNTPNGIFGGDQEVKDEVKRHFENFFKEESYNRLVLEGLVFDCVSKIDKNVLQDKFLDIKIIKKMFGVVMVPKYQALVASLLRF